MGSQRTVLAANGTDKESDKECYKLSSKEGHNESDAEGDKESDAHGGPQGCGSFAKTSRELVNTAEDREEGPP